MEIVLKVSIFITVLNHEIYINDLLDSIVKEFKSETPVFLADLGSLDGTLAQISTHTLYQENRITLTSFERGTTTLEALSIFLPIITSDYLLGMSGDDVFQTGFGQAIQRLEQPNPSEKIVINVSLLHTDEKLNPVKFQNPKWSRSRRINRMKLSLGNPGTGPGAIYPVQELLFVLKDKEFHGLLVEDYFIYWQLIDSVKFVNLPDAIILYRRHPNALGKQNANPEYSKSIGYLVGLSFSNSRNLVEKSLAVFLFLRWIRHIPKRNLRWYVTGIKLGLNS
jgi:glycosyltransferase involved in cell wall biosynthesis